MSEPPRSGEHRFPPVPSRATVAAEAYLKATAADFGLFDFVIDTVLTGDWVAFVAEQVLDDKLDYKQLNPAELAKQNPGVRTKILRKNRQTLLEMFLSRLVDNFQKYIVDLIRTVLQSRPMMLSTSQQSLTLEEVLKYDNIDNLVRDIIERKVNSLSYEGFAELCQWCSDRGIQIGLSEQDSHAVVELIATRNLITHNRGLVDDRYMRTVGSTRFQIGKPRTVEPRELFDAVALLHRVVIDTDKVALQKFSLESVEMSSLGTESK